MTLEAMLTVKADIEPQDTVNICASYSETIVDAGPMRIEFDVGNPNVFAMQIAVSCQRSLEQLGKFAGYGPIAQKYLGDLLKKESSSKVKA